MIAMFLQWIGAIDLPGLDGFRRDRFVASTTPAPGPRPRPAPVPAPPPSAEVPATRPDPIPSPPTTPGPVRQAATPSVAVLADLGIAPAPGFEAAPTPAVAETPAPRAEGAGAVAAPKRKSGKVRPVTSDTVPALPIAAALLRSAPAPMPTFPASSSWDFVRTFIPGGAQQKGALRIVDGGIYHLDLPHRVGTAALDAEGNLHLAVLGHRKIAGEAVVSKVANGRWSGLLVMPDGTQWQLDMQRR
jgi:hypothetical protein